MPKRKDTRPITQRFQPMDKQQLRNYRTGKAQATELNSNNVHTQHKGLYDFGGLPHMHNLDLDVRQTMMVRNLAQYSNLSNLKNVAFYKSKNGAVLEVVLNDDMTPVYVESGHGGVDDDGEEKPDDKKDKDGIGGGDGVNPEQPNEDDDTGGFGGTFEKKKKPKKPTEPIPTNQPKKVIKPLTKKGKKTVDEKRAIQYANKTKFEKRIDKIKKGWNVKEKAVDTYTKLVKKMKTVKQPKKMLDSITNFYQKFKSSRNKFNFFQSYKTQWERVKKAYNIKATLEELVEDLI